MQLSSGGSVATRQIAACSGVWVVRVEASALGGRCMLYVTPNEGVGLTTCRVGCCVQEDRVLDLIMLQLRLSDGLDLQAVQQQYGKGIVASLLPTVKQMMQRGLMQLIQGQRPSSQPLTPSSSSRLAAAAGDIQEPEGEAALQQLLTAGVPCRVRLTDPAGFLLSNDVIAELFAALTEFPSSERV